MYEMKNDRKSKSIDYNTSAQDINIRALVNDYKVALFILM